MITLRRRTELLNALRYIYHRQQSTVALPNIENATNLQEIENSDEYTDVPIYPEIKDLSFRAKKKREIEQWHDKIKRTPTVEEKLIKINMPRYYGFKVVKLSDEKFPYNCLPAMQHYTRTVFEKLDTKSDPESTTIQQSETSVMDKQLDSLVQSLKSEVQDALEFSCDFLSQSAKIAEMNSSEHERVFTQMVVQQINRVLMNFLATDYNYLQESEVDLNPRHEAFWQVGGINAPINTIKRKEGREWQKPMANDPVDRLMQYTATPYLALRHRKQLTPWKTNEESRNLDLAKSLPRIPYDPRTLGFHCSHQHVTNIPGFWPGSPSGFGCLSYQSRVHMQSRPDSYGSEDFKEALHVQAILSSYAWLMALANYNGFNTYSELTYPMNTQTIITNGRDWSFYEYQLNTLLVHTNHIDENPLVNFCRGTDELKLYQEFDDKGKCIGFNEDVLRHLIKFYTNTPTIERSADELKPFLGKKYRVAADYPSAEQRTFLENIFKHIASNRPRHLEIPEIYLWEKIYKIDNKTRPMDARRRFFEVGINPWQRTLDQHQKVYIPRALRANGPRDKKNKWKKTYYPQDSV